jgi:hypothetical protein
VQAKRWQVTHQRFELFLVKEKEMGELEVERVSGKE